MLPRTGRHEYAIEVVAADLWHVNSIANRMGYYDRIECKAFGKAPKEALRLSLRGSILAWTATVDGRPEAMWGMQPISVIEGTGSPWMLGTEESRKHARAFLKSGLDTIERMKVTAPRLSNMVARDNRAALTMLRHWGFDIGSEHRMIGGIAFLPFSMGY